jgi:hypothetical protein
VAGHDRSTTVAVIVARLKRSERQRSTNERMRSMSLSHCSRDGGVDDGGARHRSTLTTLAALSNKSKYRRRYHWKRRRSNTDQSCLFTCSRRHRRRRLRKRFCRCKNELRCWTLHQTVHSSSCFTVAASRCRGRRSRIAVVVRRRRQRYAIRVRVGDVGRRGR